MESIKPILQQLAEQLTGEVKTVSKRFSNTIENKVTKNSIMILGSPHLHSIITGRPPTSPYAKKGSPTLQEIIYSWIGDKGIVATADEQGKVMSQLSLSWAISQRIHMDGDKLYRRVQSGGQPNNIYDKILNESRINQLMGNIGKIYAMSISSDLINEFKQ